MLQKLPFSDKCCYFLTFYSSKNPEKRDSEWRVCLHDSDAA